MLALGAFGKYTYFTYQRSRSWEQPLLSEVLLRKALQGHEEQQAEVVKFFPRAHSYTCWPANVCIQYMKICGVYHTKPELKKFPLAVHRADWLACHQRYLAGLTERQLRRNQKEKIQLLTMQCRWGQFLTASVLFWASSPHRKKVQVDWKYSICPGTFLFVRQNIAVLSCAGPLISLRCGRAVEYPNQIKEIQRVFFLFDIT